MSKVYAQRFLKTLESIDMFGVSPNLMINRDHFYKTKLGGIVTLGIICFLFYIFIDMVLGMHSRSDPNVFNKVEYTPEPQKYQLDDSNFFVIIGIADAYGRLVVNQPNETYFYLNFTITEQYVTLDNKTGQHITLEKCQAIDMIPCNTKNVKNEIMNVSPERQAQTYCLNPDTWQNYQSLSYLQGTAQNQKFTYLRLSVSLCSEGQNLSVICAPKDKLQTLSRGMSYMIFSDYIIDETRKGDPFQILGKHEIEFFDTSQARTQIFTLSHTLFETVENFYYFFKETNIAHYLLFKSSKQSMSSPPDSFMNYIWLLDDQQTIYYRSYMSIVDILARTSAIFELLILIATAILTPLITKSYNLEMIDDIYSYSDQNNKKKNETLLSKIKNFDLSNSGGQVPKGTSEAELQNFLTMKNSPLNSKEIISSYFSSKNNYIKAGMKRIEENLDIRYLVKKLMEVEKLKHIFLNEDQLKLFDLIPKPKIYLENQLDEMKQTQDIYLPKENKVIDIVNQSLESYKATISSKGNQVNQKLIKLLDKDIKELFNHLISHQQQFIDQRANQMEREAGYEFLQPVQYEYYD